MQIENAPQPTCLHIEARVLAFTQFVLNGVPWNVTLREGATADEAPALPWECYKVQESLAKAGAIFVLTRDARESLQRRPGKASKEHDAGIFPTNGNHYGNHQETPDHAWCKVHGAEMQR
jgi:hypothetical protein